MALLDLYLGKGIWQEALPGVKQAVHLFDFTGNFRNLHKFEEGFRTFKKICEMSDAEKQSYWEENRAQA